MYEYVATALPIRHVHPDDENGLSTCDSEMLNLLDKMQQKDDDEKEIDPRWEKLKELTAEEMAKWLYEFIDSNEVHPAEEWILEYLKKKTDNTVWD